MSKPIHVKFDNNLPNEEVRKALLPSSVEEGGYSDSEMQDPMCEELELIPNDVMFADCTWLEPGHEEDCPSWQTMITTNP